MICMSFKLVFAINRILGIFSHYCLQLVCSFLSPDSFYYIETNRDYVVTEN